MSSRKSKRKPLIILIVVTVIVAALCAGCFFAGNAISAYRDKELRKRQEEVKSRNLQKDQEYAARLAAFQSETAAVPSAKLPRARRGGYFWRCR